MSKNVCCVSIERQVHQVARYYAAFRDGIVAGRRLHLKPELLCVVKGLVLV